MKRTFIIIVLLLISIGFISCVQVQKFSKITSENEGILVIALETHNNTPYPGFSYIYFFNYSPETPAKIRIDPNTLKPFLIFENFPSGKYKIDGFTARAFKRGIGDPTTMSRYYKISKDYPFVIKPNQITVFDYKLIVSIDDHPNGMIQNNNFQRLVKKDREIILEKIAKLENAELWKLSSQN